MRTDTAMPFLLDRPRLARWALLYAMVVVYGSVAVGPLGFNFVPRPPMVVWHEFLTTHYVPHGSGQRADWMANLLMLVPFGFLMAGALIPPRGRWRRRIVAACVLVLCVGFVLAVKYAQLFFPGRTVTLNYIAAQGIGAALGVAAFNLWCHPLIVRALRPFGSGGRHALIGTLGAYSFLLLLFLLTPFDFVLSAAGVRGRLALVPALLRALPGEGRPPAVIGALLLAAVAGMIPVGALLALARPRRSLAITALYGLACVVAIGLLSLLTLSGTPTLAQMFCDEAGIVAGSVLARSLRPTMLIHGRQVLARFVPLLSVPYLVLVAFFGGLFTPIWRTPAHALAVLDGRGLIPLWNDYIVSKEQAVSSTVLHIAMYAPIGAMVWLRRGAGRRQAILAAALAALCSLGVELGRWMKPGLQPDFNEVVIGGLAAAMAVIWLPRAWRMFVDVSDASDAASAHKVSTAPSGTGHIGAAASAAGFLLPRAILSALCLAALGVLLARYPLPTLPLGGALLAYGTGLWLWPGLWLLVVPAVLPAYDLTPWSGWLMVSESDAFLLVTLGILVIRAPPAWLDVRLRGLPGIVLTIVAGSLIVSVFRGMTAPQILIEGSSNPYLLPENALRLAKGVVWAFLLLPFLRARQRRQGDGFVLLGSGMVLGLAAVAAATLAERALFPGIFDFASGYRVVGTFSSMEFGGDDIGTYLAMALPFLVVCLPRPRPVALAGVLLVAVSGVYALLVTYARAAYGAAAIATVATGLLLIPLVRRRGWRGIAGGAIGIVLFMVAMGVPIGIGLDSGFMETRMVHIQRDFHVRVANWNGGLALMGHSLGTWALGMGLGTYPRVARLSRPFGAQPTNYVVLHADTSPFLRLETGSPLYFGQKVPVQPDGTYHLSMRYRVLTRRGGVSVALCEKVLLYSFTCSGVGLHPAHIGVWERAETSLSTVGMSAWALGGLLRRPVELALFGSAPGETLDVSAVRLTDRSGRNMVRNGNFRHGTDRWYPNDDNHLAWQIKNQYLTTFFEAGALGLFSWLLLGGVALAGAIRGAVRGVRMAAPIAGALLAFLACAVFDDELAAPRVATLYYLIAFAGLMLWTERVRPSEDSLAEQDAR